jgi:TRAP-type mannitol/chloroaromatic compound transport system substrate-binding protein
MEIKDLAKPTRRGFLRFISLSGIAAFITSCLSANAPTTSATPAGAGATAGGGVGQPGAAATQLPTVTLKMQSTWALQDPFHQVFLGWIDKVQKMSNGRIKIDALPSGAVAGAFALIDAVHSGTLDGGHGVTGYWFGKDRATSLFGSGPSYGLDAQGILGWYYFGGGEALYQGLLQNKLKLNIVSFPHGPMNNQPLGWFKDEIKSPDDFKGMKFRTVALAVDIYSAMGASVVALGATDVVPALERGVIDAAEFNNTSSDTVYGFPDVRKVLMTQSYHQPTEVLEILINKGKFDALPDDLKAVMRFGAYAASAEMTWLFMDRNSKDYAGLKAKGVKIIKSPDSVRQAQLNAWKALIEKDSATNPEFKAIIASLRDWAQRVVPWQRDINIPTPDTFAYDFYFKP